MQVGKMRDVTRAKIPSLCGAIWRTILNFYASQDVWVNCYRIHQKSLNFIYSFKFYSNFTNKNVSWLHFSWSTQYVALSFAEFVAVISAFVKKYRFYSTPCGCLMSVCPLKFSWFSLVCRLCFYLFCSHSRLLVPFISSCKMWYVCFYFICIFFCKVGLW